MAVVSDNFEIEEKLFEQGVPTLDLKRNSLIDVSEDDSQPDDFTPEELKIVLRRLDWQILGFLWFCFMFLNFDRYNISAALTGTFLQDLNITTDIVANGTSILLAAFCIFEIPSNMVIQKLGAHRWLPFLMFAWGMVSTFQIFMTNTTGFYITRFLIGAFEGGWIPGVILYMGKFYTKNELSLRLGLFWTCNLFASAVSGLLAYGILRMQGIAGLSGWQWLFLIEGAATVLCSIFAFLYMPENPMAMTHKFWGLDERSRRIATERLIRDDPSKGKPRSWIGFKVVVSALWDFKPWPIIVLGFFGFAAPAGYSLFLPYIIKSLGFGALESNILLIPGGIAAIILTVLFSWLSQKTGRRWFFVPIGNLIYMCGLLMSIFIPVTNKYGQYAASLIAIMGFMPWHGIVASWLSENTAPEGNRAIVISAYIISVNLAAVLGVQIYRANDAPRYVLGHSISIGLLVICGSMAIFQRLYLEHVNKKREKIWQSWTEEQRQEEQGKKWASSRMDFKFNY